MPIALPTNELVALPATGPILLSELAAAFPGLPGVNSNLASSYRGLLPSLPTSSQPLTMAQMRGAKAPTPVHNRALAAVDGTGVAMNSIGDFKLTSTTDNSLSVTLCNFVAPAAQYQLGLAYTSPWLPQGFSLDTSSGTIRVADAAGYASACNFTVTAANAFGNSSSMGFTLTAPGQTTPVTGTGTVVGSAALANSTGTYAAAEQVTNAGLESIAFTLELNPLDNATLDGSGNLSVVDAGTGQSYSVVVLASDSEGSVELRYEIQDSGGPITALGGSRMGTVTLSNASATYPLSSYFTDNLAGGTDITYMLTQNPESNASIDESRNLVVANGGSGTGYNVIVTASNAWNTTQSTLHVTDGDSGAVIGAMTISPGPLPPQPISNNAASAVIAGNTYTFTSDGTNSGPTSSYVWSWGEGLSAFLDGEGSYDTNSPFAYQGTASTPGFPGGAWWAVQTSGTVNITDYTISILGGGMTEWYVVGSMDGSTWTQIDHQITGDGSVGTGTATFDVSSNAAFYAHHRFILAAADGQSWGARVSGFYFSVGGVTTPPAAGGSGNITGNITESPVLGSVSLSNVTAVYSLGSFFTDATGGSDLAFSLTANPQSNASIDGSGNLSVVDGGTGLTYGVQVTASNATGYFADTLTVTDGGGNITTGTSGGSLGSVTLSNITANVALSAFFADNLAGGTDIAYSIVDNPKGNASISGSTLSVSDVGEGSNYAVVVQAANGFNSVEGTLNVTDGNGVPVALGGLYGVTLSNATASYPLLSFFGDGVEGDTNFTFSIPTNPTGNASIVGGNTLEVSNRGTGSSYEVVVQASNASGEVQTTMSFTDYTSPGGIITESTPLGSVSLSNVTASYGLRSFFSDGTTGGDISYSITANPKGTASISSGHLLVPDGGNGTMYEVTVLADNGTSSLSDTVYVTESGGPISESGAHLGSVTLSNAPATYSLTSRFTDSLAGGTDIVYSFAADPYSNVTFDGAGNMTVLSAGTGSTYDVVLRATNAWNEVQDTLTVTDGAPFVMSLQTANWQWAGFGGAPSLKQGATFAAAGGYVGLGSLANVNSAGWFSAFSVGSDTSPVATLPFDVLASGGSTTQHVFACYTSGGQLSWLATLQQTAASSYGYFCEAATCGGGSSASAPTMVFAGVMPGLQSGVGATLSLAGGAPLSSPSVLTTALDAYPAYVLGIDAATGSTLEFAMAFHADVVRVAPARTSGSGLVVACSTANGSGNSVKYGTGSTPSSASPPSFELSDGTDTYVFLASSAGVPGTSAGLRVYGGSPANLHCLKTSAVDGAVFLSVGVQCYNSSFNVGGPTEASSTTLQLPSAVASTGLTATILLKLDAGLNLVWAACITCDNGGNISYDSFDVTASGDVVVALAPDQAASFSVSTLDLGGGAASTPASTASFTAPQSFVAMLGLARLSGTDGSVVDTSALGALDGSAQQPFTVDNVACGGVGGGEGFTVSWSVNNGGNSGSSAYTFAHSDGTTVDQSGTYGSAYIISFSGNGAYANPFISTFDQSTKPAWQSLLARSGGIFNNVPYFSAAYDPADGTFVYGGNESSYYSGSLSYVEPGTGREVDLLSGYRYNSSDFAAIKMLAASGRLTSDAVVVAPRVTGPVGNVVLWSTESATVAVDSAFTGGTPPLTFAIANDPLGTSTLAVGDGSTSIVVVGSPTTTPSESSVVVTATDANGLVATDFLGVEYVASVSSSLVGGSTVLILQDPVHNQFFATGQLSGTALVGNSVDNAPGDGFVRFASVSGGSGSECLVAIGNGGSVSYLTVDGETLLATETSSPPASGSLGVWDVMQNSTNSKYYFRNVNHSTGEHFLYSVGDGTLALASGTSADVYNYGGFASTLQPVNGSISSYTQTAGGSATLNLFDVFTDSTGGGDLTFSIAYNGGNNNAAIIGSNLVVTDQGNGNGYPVIPIALNSHGRAAIFISFSDTDVVSSGTTTAAPAMPNGPLGSVTLSASQTAQYQLPVYFADAASFAIVSNPEGNASLDGNNTLYVSDQGTGNTYAVVVSATNASGTTEDTLTVTDSGIGGK